jgi:hypothetical protein
MTSAPYLMTCDTCDYREFVADPVVHCYMFRERPSNNFCLMWRPDHDTRRAIKKANDETPNKT